MTDEHDSEWRRRIRGLPREIEPSRDLWPGIEARLGSRAAPRSARPRRLGAFALAASVAVAFFAGLLVGRQEAPTAAPEDGVGYLAIALRGAVAASEREYQAAFRQFPPLGPAPAVFSERAVERIERGWSEMQEVEAALLAALAEHPEDAFLNRRLLELRRQQLEFMKQLAMVDMDERRST